MASPISKTTAKRTVSIGDAQPQQAKILELARGQWIQEKTNTCFIGNAGTGENASLIAGPGDSPAGQRAALLFTAATLVKVQLEEAQKQYRLERLLSVLDKVWEGASKTGSSALSMIGIGQGAQKLRSPDQKRVFRQGAGRVLIESAGEPVLLAPSQAWIRRRNLAVLVPPARAVTDAEARRRCARPRRPGCPAAGTSSRRRRWNRCRRGTSPLPGAVRRRRQSQPDGRSSPGPRPRSRTGRPGGTGRRASSAANRRC